MIERQADEPQISKLGCKCGHVITDQTDSLPYKASLLRDEVENEFWDEVHCELKPLVEAAESGDKAAIAEAFGKFAPWISATDELQGPISSIYNHRMSTAYECQNCGRLWVQKDASDKFVSYVPEEEAYGAILAVASGESENRD
ncbi:hypothetical protein [Pseudomonas sp. GM60]|jgi:hypothetical protein|uniref:hypothetical protein n=1 Tax=Pseudomonas sp. GM60 TaxID=1144334 RepID=UPI0002705DE6|nr:hypothetical protein [Pseudomonas sp. GM60]EJM82137.1 hypothetical protein PMI32_02885 [Pseudomonas sp. GM60]